MADAKPSKEGFSRDLADLLLSDIACHLRFFAAQPGYQLKTEHTQFRH